MGKINVDSINDKYMDLWRRHYGNKKNMGVLMPLLYPDLEAEAILFVGLNPSFSNRIWKGILKGKNIFMDKEADEYFKWPKSDDFSFDIAKESEVMARENYKSYFKYMWDISKLLKKNIENIDIFAHRGTYSKECLKLVQKKDESLTPFGQEQFDIFYELIALLKPLAVIIVNAKASEIFKKQTMGLVYDSDTGFYRDPVLSGGQCPIFLSGMISGIHPLDIPSKERLAWHIAKFFGISFNPESFNS